MNKYYLISFVLMAIAFVCGFYLYPTMPQLMPSHWGIDGKVDGYADKIFGLFLMPIMGFFLLLLLAWFPKADPKQENVKYNQKYYEKVVFIIILFLFYIYCLTITAALGYRPDIPRYVTIALGFMFYYIGVQMENIKPNWFFGIRTPWTIHDDEIWKKTHKKGGKFFGIFGITMVILGIWKPETAFYFLMICIVSLVFWSFAYPYKEWKKNH